MASLLPAINAPSTVRMRLYRIGGVAVWATVSVGFTALASKWPWVTPGGTLITWYLGKLLGIPINDVLSAALARKPPAELASIAVNAIMTMPVEQINPSALAVIESVRPVAIERLTTDVDIPRPAAVPNVTFDQKDGIDTDK